MPNLFIGLSEYPLPARKKNNLVFMDLWCKIKNKRKKERNSEPKTSDIRTRF